MVTDHSMFSMTGFRRESGPMPGRSERYTVKDLAAALDATPAAVRRHLRALGVRSGDGWRHEWDAGRYRRLLEAVGQRIAGSVPASGTAYATGLAGDGAHGGLQEAPAVFAGLETPESPAFPEGMEEMQISAFKAKCLAVLERVGKTGKPVLVTRFGQPVAQIVPPPSGEWLGAMAGTGRILGDLTAPALDPEEWEALG